MPIRLTLPVENVAYETQAAISFERKREDIAKLLIELKAGKSLLSIFSSAPVANAVATKLKREGLVDSNGSLTAKGEAFIKSPRLQETEEGIFSINYCIINADNFVVPFVPQITRKLSSEKTNKTKADIPTPVFGAEFGIDTSERGFMTSVRLIGSQNAFVFPQQAGQIVINLTQKTYEYKGQKYALGDEFYNLAFDFAINKAKELFPQCVLTEDMSVVVVNIDDFDIRSLMSGITTLSSGPLEMVDVPLIISSEAVASRYVFLWLYERLMSGEYYSLEEMEELVQNEIATNPIIHDSLRDYVSTITVTRGSFKRYLSPDKFSNLEYRLKIMEEYLGIQSMQNTIFSKARNYGELVDAITNEVPPSEVTGLSLVMGYPFVKTRNNRILDSLDALKQYYPNITVVFKKWRDRPNQEEDPNMRTMVLQKGVKIKDKEGLIDDFHDRYLVFDLRGGGSKILLCTCEIGQIFKPGTTETKGTMFPIRNSEVVKGGKSLLSIIKE